MTATITLPSTTVVAEAAEWFIELQAGEPALERRAAFVEWLRRSPVHVDEFLRIVALQADLGRLPQVAGLDVDALLACIQPSAAAQNVIDFAPNARFGQPFVPARRRAGAYRGWRVRTAAVAAAVAAVAAVSWYAHQEGARRAQHYITGTGEQRAVTLLDGSRMRINVRSDLEVRVDARTRDIQLQSGEALFQVAKDPLHPFRVHTPHSVIEAKGTRFDVRVRNGRTVVVLLEGHVQVTPPGSAGRAAHAPLPEPVLLDPGQSVTVLPDSSAGLQPTRVDVAAATAWVQRRLVFEDAPLARIVEEFNLYSGEPVVMDDPAIGSIRVTASFDAGNAELFARSVGSAAALRVTRSADGIWHIGRP